VDGAFRVGTWLVQPKLNSISSGEAAVRLEPKVMEVLVCLASRPGEPVSKETLLKTVWPDTFVSDDVLTRSISELRRALNDDARSPRFIETIAKRGYRLLAPAQPVLQSPAAPVPAWRQISSPSKRPRPRRSAAAFAGVALGFALLLAFGISARRQRLVAQKPLPTIRSLAVLPLQNLSGDPAQEYFADGMTEELITELSRASALRVISRTSVMRYKKTDKSLPQIARELGVDAVVEGSVLRSGDRVRITAQLIYAPTDSHLWAQSYEREMKDVLALQSEISGAIVKQVQTQLSVQPSLMPPAPSKPTVDPRAYEAYLKATHYWAKYTGPDLDKSRRYFEQAIKFDPNYSRGYSGLGDVYLSLVSSDLLPDTDLRKVEFLEIKAMQLDPSLAEPHEAMTWVRLYRWDLAGARQEAERALVLNPSDPDAHVAYLWCLLLQGKLNHAVPDLQKIRQLDPASPPFLASLGSILDSAQRFDEALQLCREAVDFQHDFGLAHWCVGRAYIGKQQPDRAISEFRQALAAGDMPYFRRDLALAQAALGNRRPALEVIRQFEAKKDGSLDYEIATLQAVLGNNEAALNRLEMVYSRHGRKLVFASLEPAFEPLHSDLRFRDLVRRVTLSR